MQIESITFRKFGRRFRMSAMNADLVLKELNENNVSIKEYNCGCGSTPQLVHEVSLVIFRSRDNEFPHDLNHATSIEDVIELTKMIGKILARS